jgi:NDP-sugar pyrophosphorylase family protein
MKAMVLAAGLGTRLGELTRETPKCLMPVGSKTLLQLVLEKLKKVGVVDVVINLHYLANKVESYLIEHDNFNLNVFFSHEQDLLGTGGGVFRVAEYFCNEKCFIIYNSDVYSELDLAAFVESHLESKALATLAIMKRETSRPLYFDSNMLLAPKSDRVDSYSDQAILDQSSIKPWGFSGIQVVSPEIFEFGNDFHAPFSIIDVYHRARLSGKKIAGYDMDKSYWIDAGSPERLNALRVYRQQQSVDN